MSKRITVISLVLAIVLLSIFTVYAASVGWTWGRGSLHGHAIGWGWGSQESIKVEVSATIAFYSMCYNPGNGNAAPGQNPTVYNESASAFPTADKSGKFEAFVDFDYDAGQTWSAMGLNKPSPTAAGCPNDQWVVDDIVYCIEFWSADATTSSLKNKKKVDAQSFDSTDSGAFDAPGSVCQ
jgi:hypothetical protein